MNRNASNKNGLSQWRALSYVYCDLFWRDGWKLGFFLALVDMGEYYTLAEIWDGWEEMPDFIGQIWLIGIFLWFPLCFLAALTDERREGVRRAYAALPIRRRALAYGVLMGALWVYLLQAALLYSLLVLAGGEAALPLPVFVACLILLAGGLIGGHFVQDYLRRATTYRAGWTVRVSSALAPIAWMALSFVFLFRMAGKPAFEAADWGTMYDRHPAWAWLASHLVACDAPFVPLNLLFLALSATVLVLSIVHAEDTVHRNKRSRQGPGRHGCLWAYRTGKPRSIRHLLSPIAAIPPIIVFNSLFLPSFVLWLAERGHRIPTMVFPFAFFLAYAFPLGYSLCYLRPLRTLPLSFASLASAIFAVPALCVMIVAVVAVLIAGSRHLAVHGPYLLSQMAAGCLLAHLVCLASAMGVEEGYFGTLALGGFGILYIFSGVFEAIAAQPPLDAWCSTVAFVGIAAIIGWLSLTRLIRRSSLAYRNREQDIKSYYGS